MFLFFAVINSSFFSSVFLDITARYSQGLGAVRRLCEAKLGHA